MKTNVIRISVVAFTLVVLALPLTAAAADEVPAGSKEPKANYASTVHFVIYVDQVTDLAKQIKFVENNSWDYNTDYTLDIIYPARPQAVDPYDPAIYPDLEDISQLVGAPVNY
jgi:hypothetical protein